MKVYLDNSATSFPKPNEVLKAVTEGITKFGGNPGRGSNSMSLAAYREIFKARERAARFFNIKDSSRLVFTSNATEALNLAIKGLRLTSGEIITSSMEHNSVIRPLSSLVSQGLTLKKVKCSETGEVDPDDFKRMITGKTKLAVFTHASNVVGTILPVKQIGRICREKGIIFIVDAAQTAGCLPIDVESMCVDLLACSGHKGLLGIQGTGLLYIAPSIRLQPLKEGGTGSFSDDGNQPEELPDRFESGTLNTPGILSLCAGIKFIEKKSINKIREHEMMLIKRLVEGLKGIKGVKIYGAENEKKRAGLISLNLEGIHSSLIGDILDKKFGIIVRTGLHCSPESHKAVGSYPEGAVRFSPGYFNTADEIDYSVKAVTSLFR